MVYDACVTKKHHMLETIETQERLIRLSTPAPLVSDERIEEIRREVAAGLHDDKFQDDPYLRKLVIIGD
jgi:hypothetical protein